jgi:hypothetical protein
MSQQLSFSDLVKGATRLDSKDYEKFVTTVNKLRAEQQPDTLSPQEAALLKKINYGFPIEKWQRLQDLDVKMEETSLSEQEYTELTSLTDTYEKYCVQRIRLLKKLALLRNMSMEETLHKLGLQHGEV